MIQENKPVQSNNPRKSVIQTNIPPLRFPKFEGEWEIKKLGELLTIGSGRDYKHLGEGEIPVFGTGGLMTKVDDYLYDGETVCIGRKGTIDKPMYFNGKIWTVDTLFYTHSFINSTPKFVYNLFQRVNWKQHNEAGGVPSLSKSTIEQIELVLPTLPEQTKIASFLTAVDEKIQALKKKHSLLAQYKKGVMQKLFSSELGLEGLEDDKIKNEKNPTILQSKKSQFRQLRFKDENGKDFPAWEVKKLGEVCEYKNGGAFENQLTKDGQYFLISLNSLDINGNLKKEHKRLNITDNSLQKGDLVMVLSDVAHGNFLGLTDIIPSDNFVLNQRMGALKPKIKINRYYLKTFININQKYFKLKGQGSSQQNLSKGDIESFELQLPCIEEQTAIAHFLSALDEKINHTEIQIQQTQVWKKGLLQKMFL